MPATPAISMPPSPLSSHSSAAARSESFIPLGYGWSGAGGGARDAQNFQRRPADHALEIGIRQARAFANFRERIGFAERIVGPEDHPIGAHAADQGSQHLRTVHAGIVVQ